MAVMVGVETRMHVEATAEGLRFLEEATRAPAARFERATGTLVLTPDLRFPWRQLIEYAKGQIGAGASLRIGFDWPEAGGANAARMMCARLLRGGFMDLAALIPEDEHSPLSLRTIEDLVPAAATSHPEACVAMKALLDRRSRVLMDRSPAEREAMALRFQAVLDDALRWAADGGNIPLADLLVRHGADPRAEDSIALRWSMLANHADMAEWLVEHGADPRANRDECLKLAMAHGNAPAIALFQRHGAVPNPRWTVTGSTPAGGAKGASEVAVKVPIHGM